MVDYEKEIEKMIQNLKQENPEREVEFKENYILNINGTKIPVSILDIKEPMEKDDEKTNINKIQILYKTKEGYILIAEVTPDKEIMLYSEGMKKAGLDKEFELKESNKIELTEADEREIQQKGNKERDDKKPELDEKEENADDVEKDKEEIADELGIEEDKIYPIRTDSAFYKNHLGMFHGKNLFFFEDKQGKIRVGTRDENGKPIEDTEHFTLSSVGKMKPVIRLGDGKENVKKEIPIQTIEIKNPAKQNGENDVHDRYIAVFRGNGGYLEFDEVEQSREEGKPGVAERIEISGRKYNTQEINERTENRGIAQKPGETIRNYEGVEGKSSADDGIQTDEIFSDNETFKKQIEKDLTRTYGPMKSEKLIEMRDNVISRLENGEHYDTAIARAGIKERSEGGPTPDEKRKREG